MLRDRLQRAFGFDFAGVRIHVGAEANSVARRLQAAAFTYGHDIYFRDGRFEPQTVAGQWLIAHELAHVVQQTHRGSSAPSNASAGLERHATQAAHLAIDGRIAPSAPSGAGLTVQCQTEAELRAELDAVQARINAERIRIAGVESSAPRKPTWELGTSGKFERMDWRAIRASETKAYYNLLERRDILQLRLNFPDHQFLEQVSIKRIVTPSGEVFEIPERIADWALVKDDVVILGDKKSAGAIKSGVKGGIPMNRPVTAADVQGSFRTTKGRFTRAGNPVSRTSFGDQVLKERYANTRAKALGGKVVVTGTAADGSLVKLQVPSVNISRLNPYGQLPDTLVDEPVAAPPLRGAVPPSGGASKAAATAEAVTVTAAKTATAASGEVVVPQRGSATLSGGVRKAVTTISGEITVPPGRWKSALQGFRQGLVPSPAGIAGEIPGVILFFADRAAAREAVRRIQVEFSKMGFAKGFAAGVTGWYEEEVRLNLMNRITPYRVRGFADPAGFLKHSYILQLAEAYENQAVGLGYQFSSSQTLEWKKEMIDKGLATLAKYGSHFRGDPQALFEYDFIEKLAWTLHPITNPIVDQAIREGDERRRALESERRFGGGHGPMRE